MSDLVINASHLSKQYAIGRRRRVRTIREALTNVAARTVRAAVGARHVEAQREMFWALDDLSFQVAAGDVIGIIGRNGAGKSTLLKILSRVTEPTRGAVDVYGRVGSLLEVGTGFHEDLTGRENTYLNGAILGMSKNEIDRKFDEIVAFAELDRFIDTPAKHYSSGMYMRLAFAVAAHLETEILVVDEVLAVGDAEFQKKCLGKMDAVAKQGRTVLFISHNMDAVQRLCTKGMLLNRGRLVATGPIGDVVSRYRTQEREMVDIGRFNTRSRSGTGWARIAGLALVNPSGEPVPSCPADADLTFEMTLEMSDSSGHGASLRGLVTELVICSDQGQPLVSVMNVDDGGVQLPAASRCRVRASLSGPTFIPGRYRLNAFLGVPFLQHVDEIPDALEFEITPPEHPWRPYELHASRQIVCRRAQWSCDLETSVTTPAGHFA